MKKALNLIIALSIILTGFNLAKAQDEALNVYPVPAIFMSQNISPKFNQLYLCKRNDFIKQFLDTFNSTYPACVKEISDKNKYKTFAVYINLPRVSEYEYKRGAISDIYLPMTMSINFVNMATSETLYSCPLTHYAKYSTTAQKMEDKVSATTIINDLYSETYNNLLKAVTTKSKEDFKPFAIEAKIKDSYRSLYILDKGTTLGIAKGDLLSDKDCNQIAVIYSSLDYSVAKPLIGKPSIDSVFMKYSNSSLSQIEKPKVLFLNNLGDEKIYNLFSTALGANADFSLITINKTFYDMQQALTSLNMGFNMKNTQNREVPDYFLMLHFSKPLYTQYPSNRDFASLDKYSVLLCGTIFDKSGRVIFSKCVDEEITDTVVSGIKFDDSARYEILFKNALNKLALSFANEVKFKKFQLDICATEGEYIYLNDANGFLKENNTLTIFKKVSAEKGGQEITIPTWEYKVLRVENGKVECKPMFPIVDGLNFPSKKDKALITTATKSCNKAEMFNFYPDKMALDGNQVGLKDFQNIAFSAISSGMKSPVVFDKVTFSEQIKDLNAGYGFRQKLEAPDNTQKLKIRPVYKVELLEEKKDGSLLKQKYQITVGMVSYNDNAVLLKDGLKQEVSITVPSSDNSDIVQYELLKFIYPLLQQIAFQF